jgi:hypothetical protein
MRDNAKKNSPNVLCSQAFGALTSECLLAAILQHCSHDRTQHQCKVLHRIVLSAFEAPEKP